MLIIMAGLPGSGKSTVARQVAEKSAGIVLSKDTVRHALFPPELVEYSDRQDDFVIGVLLQTASYTWGTERRKTIVLDGRTFSRRSQREQVIEFAQKAGQPWRIIECICSDEVARERLRGTGENHPAANRTPALYDEVKARWEPIEEEHTVIRTDNEEGLKELHDLEF